jgi:hypothetical protein
LPWLFAFVLNVVIPAEARFTDEACLPAANDQLLILSWLFALS